MSKFSNRVLIGTALLIAGYAAAGYAGLFPSTPVQGVVYMKAGQPLYAAITNCDDSKPKKFRLVQFARPHNEPLFESGKERYIRMAAEMLAPVETYRIECDGKIQFDPIEGVKIPRTGLYKAVAK